MLSGRRHIRHIEAIRSLDRDGFLQQLLDVSKQIHIISRDERYSLTRTSSTTRTTNTVDIILSHFREVKVDNMRQRLNVKTTCSDISSNEGLYPGGLECIQGIDTSCLTLVAVDGG